MVHFQVGADSLKICEKIIILSTTFWRYKNEKGRQDRATFFKDDMVDMGNESESKSFSPLSATTLYNVALGSRVASITSQGSQEQTPLRVAKIYLYQNCLALTS